MERTPSPPAFVRTLAPALRQAASIARALEGRVANRPKADEATPVKAALTIADTAAQEALLVPLHAAFPTVRLEAEEDTPTVRDFSADGPALVVVDPVDGTLRFYLEGRGPYAVLVGLAVEDAYVASLVAVPREGLFFDAVRGAGARGAHAEEEPRPLRADSDGRRVLVSHDLPAAAVERLRGRGFEVQPASGGAISVAPMLPGVCAGLRLAADEGSGVSVRGRIGALVAREAGARVRCEHGPFPDDIRARARALLVATDDDTLAALEDALSVAL